MTSSFQENGSYEILKTLVYIFVGAIAIVVSLILLSSDIKSVIGIILLVGGVAIAGWGCSDKIKTRIK